jgi:serine/threonine-protein kinase
MDFGIARAVADTSSTMTQTAAVIGTAQYLSPEQARGETVDARSDLYSTGCLLYELLTGRPPFVGESPVSVAYQHVREQALPPSSFDPDIPPEVDAVVLKALAKSREERYQSASEMRQDIHRVLAGQQVTAPMAAVAETRAIPATYAPAAATQTYRQTEADALLPPGGDDVDEAQAARARRNRGLAYFLLGLAIVAVAVGAYALFTSLGKDNGGGTANPPTKVSVPDVTGKTAAQATTLLTEQGLKFAQGPSETSDTVGKGLAIRQTPTANTEAEKDSTVTVVFSAGRSAFPVPDVIGKSESQARKALEGTSANFKVKEATVKQDSAEKEGTVLAVNPDPAGQYPSGTEFTLTVSTGKELVEVPNVVTVPVDDATEQLKKLGFTVGYANGQDPSKVDQTVLAQSLTANKKYPKGSTITLTVNNLPEETPTPTPTPTPTETPEDPTTPPITIG